MNIQEFRQKYPQYNKLSDQELADRMYQKFYSDRLSKKDFYNKIGVSQQPTKTQGTYDALLPQQGIPESQFQKRKPGQDPYEYVGGQVTGDDTTGFLENTWNAIGAHAQAGYAGVMALGSTLAKAADAIGVAPEGTAESAQAEYEEAEELYQEGDVPGTGVTKFAGEMAALGLGGKGLGKLVPFGLLGKTAQKTGEAISKIPGGSKISGAASRMAKPKTIKGEYAQSVGQGAAAGGTAVGLLNAPGQDPEDVFNEKGAALGAGLGGLLGPAGKFVSRYGKDTASYQRAVKEADEAGYEGPVVARDFGDKAVKDIKVAWMDNLVDNTLRTEQLDAITPSVKKIANKLLNVSEKHGVHRMAQVVRGLENRMERQSSAMHKAVFDEAKKQGITKVTVNKSKQTATEILKEFKKMPGDLRKTLKKISNYKKPKPVPEKDPTLGQLLGVKPPKPAPKKPKKHKMDIEELNKLKGKDIWSFAEKYQKAGRSSVENQEMANQLRKLYWDITDDIGESLGKSSGLRTSWEAAKEYTRGVKSIFNYQNNKKLVNAIKDINENGGALKTFYKDLVDPVSTKGPQYYSKELGPSFTKAAKHATMRRIFNKNFSTEAKGLNLNTFFKDIREAHSAGTLDDKMVQAIGGMEKVFNRVQKAQQTARQANAPSRIKYSMPQLQVAATAAGYYAGGVPGAGGAALLVYGGPRLLKSISRNSRLKNLLIGLSRVWGKNPKTTELLMDKTGKQMSKAGAVLKRNTGDSLTLDIEQRENNE